ncbi:ABC transporter permease [Aliikangiella maris]|uniref:ABC transporter permease n=2 Tax=Aliikangiella maris TaxID=3162458 RepID=A0ABV3MP86_9GAMM
MRRFLAILTARNLEFFRDRAALSWNFLFPILLLFGFAFVFNGDGNPLYKVGLVINPQQNSAEDLNNTFTQLKHFEFVTYNEMTKGILKVDQHKIDLLVDFTAHQYWLNETSAKGYIVEQLLLASFPAMQQSTTNGRAIRYLDWVMPGILGMNMMFSCLFGVGYVIVRYRKNGVLKRFQATPLSAFEFLSGQIVSRLLIVLMTTLILFFGSNLLLDFYILGSLLDLFIIAAAGASSMIALSLLIASRANSEELTGGMLNITSWPMMFLSGVWFSLEGSPSYVQQFAQIFPLTHLLDAARAIMTDGASLIDVMPNLLTLIGMTIGFTLLGSFLFNWGSERS